MNEIAPKILIKPTFVQKRQTKERMSATNHEINTNFL